jgi:hypothetical protein
LTLLTKDARGGNSFIQRSLSHSDTEAIYDFKHVEENSILRWTPIDGGPADFAIILGIQPFELMYVPADSAEHAWNTLYSD